MEVFMIPRLINNLESSLKTQVIWNNDVSDIEKFKNIDKVIMLGLHPTTKAPYLLNYATCQEYNELNFEITAVWNFIRERIMKERLEFEFNSQNDQITGNYIMDFNKNFELVYMNSYEDELKTFFNFPNKIESAKDITLEKLVKNKHILETLKKIIEDQSKLGALEYHITKPNITIRFHYGANTSFKGFCLIFRSNMLGGLKQQDTLNDLAIALTPMALNIDTADADNLDNLDTISMSNVSKLESVGLGLRNRGLPKLPSRFHPSREEAKPTSKPITGSPSHIDLDAARPGLNVIESDNVGYRRRGAKPHPTLLIREKSQLQFKESSTPNLSLPFIRRPIRQKLTHNFDESKKEQTMSPELEQLLELDSVKYSISRDYIDDEPVATINAR